MSEVKINATKDYWEIIGLSDKKKHQFVTPSDPISNQIRGLHACLEMLHTMPPGWYSVATVDPDPMFMVNMEFVAGYIDADAQMKLSDIIANKRKHLKYLDL